MGLEKQGCEGLWRGLVKRVRRALRRSSSQTHKYESCLNVIFTPHFSVKGLNHTLYAVCACTSKVGFYDFMVGICNYCVDHKDNLSMLAFDVYDRHTSGTITEADLEEMLIDVWGPKW